jgi:hypothetical protein
LAFEKDIQSSFGVIKVTAPEPLFAKELADVVLAELESLNRHYKSLTVSEKTTFIENRIAAVENDLEKSEKVLKDFNEKNRQATSPSLLLELNRLERNVDIQEGVFLTLKQQLELAKIEEVQETSVIQILDRPEIAPKQSNKNLIQSLVLSLIFGMGLGVLIGFIRSYLNNDDLVERKKLRRSKAFFKKKIIDLFKDHRVAGIVSGLMLIGLPLFLGTQSTSPVFFGMYSRMQMIVNTVFIITFLFSSGLFINLIRKKFKSL